MLFALLDVQNGYHADTNQMFILYSTLLQLVENPLYRAKLATNNDSINKYISELYQSIKVSKGDKRKLKIDFVTETLGVASGRINLDMFLHVRKQQRSVYLLNIFFFLPRSTCLRSRQ